MIDLLTNMALSLLRTLDSIATPCSVKANGICLRPPLSFEVAICVLKLIINEFYSSLVSSNIKSSPSKRFQFLRTASFNLLVST